jgi:uncharacterized protein (DUF302 family)
MNRETGVDGPDRSGVDGTSVAAAAMTTTVRAPYDRTVTATREALAQQGFGVLTEIDIRAVMRAKLAVDVEPQIILGACRPPLAYAALQAEPGIGLLLPCNVVVRSIGDDVTLVEAMDPAIMVTMTGNPQLSAVAAEARTRLKAALESLSPPHHQGDRSDG